MKNAILFLSFILILLIISCNTDKGNRKNVEKISEEEFKTDFSQSARDIFYNMYLPCELVEIIRRDTIEFNPNILNPLSNINNYSSSNKKALNLGIYGIDLGYLRIHDNLVSKEYYKAIYRLARELGIPNNQVSKVLDYIELGADSDSLYEVTCNLFEVTDEYLTANNRQSTAALIILGGWIETMYIVSNIEESDPSQRIMTSIAKQKYSLNSMVSFLTLCQEDPLVSNYLLKLNELKDIYDSVEIYFESEKDIQIDTVNKNINTETAQIDIKPSEFYEIKEIVNVIRNHIVE